MHHDLRTLDSNLLKTLDALLDERSVTRAAERLALTQPAVSAMLNRLRDAFDDPLFTRSQRGIVPTLCAPELAAPVKQILYDVNPLLQLRAFSPASATLTFTLAATDYALRALIVPFMAALGRERRITLAVSSFMVLPDILRVSELLAVVPARLAHPLTGLAVLEPPLAIPGFIKSLAWHEWTHREEGQRWLRETAEKRI